ncbi:MAG: hypothetical protein ACP5FH_09475, partial [Terracidiphilus sp.]
TFSAQRPTLFPWEKPTLCSLFVQVNYARTLSSFAEEFFRRLGAKLQRPMLLRKGELHRLVQFVDAKSISNEVAQKLAALLSLLDGS